MNIVEEEKRKEKRKREKFRDEDHKAVDNLSDKKETQGTVTISFYSILC